MPDDAAPFSRPNAPLGPPIFLTIEEAAAILRIGRTAAYLLARRWEDTGGAGGLPVVRFGRLLRVPVHELERLAAGAIDLTPGAPVRPTSEPEPTPPTEPPAPSKRTPRESRRRVNENQASLFPEAS